MECAYDIEKQSSFDPVLLCDFDCFPDLSHLSRKYDLPWGIQVGHVHIRRARDLKHAGFFASNKGSHCAGSDITRLFHVLSSIGDKAETSRKVECLSNCKCSEFS